MKCDCCGKEVNNEMSIIVENMSKKEMRPAVLCDKCHEEDIKGGGFLYPVDDETRKYEEYMIVVKKILSLGFQGKHKEADELCEKLGKNQFKLFKNKDAKTYRKILSLVRENKFEEAKRLVKKLENKGYSIKIV